MRVAEKTEERGLEVVADRSTIVKGGAKCMAFVIASCAQGLFKLMHEAISGLNMWCPSTE